MFLEVFFYVDPCIPSFGKMETTKHTLFTYKHFREPIQMSIHQYGHDNCRGNVCFPPACFNMLI